MSIMIIIILFLYSSYLTLEKYIVTGHIFRLRTNDQLLQEQIRQEVLETKETPEVTAQEDLVGKSHFHRTIHEYSGQCRTGGGTGCTTNGE